MSNHRPTASGATRLRARRRVRTSDRWYYQQAYKYERGINRIAAGRLHALARALGVEPGYFFEGLGEPPRPTTEQRMLLDLAQSFTRLSRRQQEALAEMARALAGAETEAAPGPEREGDETT